ncbi:MAG: ATP-binding protein [Prevotella sp.]|nr:ATP-binding protein [Prevotella sp.]
MLVNFTFQNFRSFRDEKTLSMETASIKELNDSVIQKNLYRLLPAAVMYGANSSGKSNVLLALKTMRNVLLDSVKLNPKDDLDFQPFMLDLKSHSQPTSFEIQFLLDDIKYRYGFEYNRKRICNEWLYEKCANQREFNLFLRADDEFEISKTRFPEGIGKDKATPSNRLFVSLVAQLNGSKSMRILDWFNDCKYLSSMESYSYKGDTMLMFSEHLEGWKQALDFFHHTQLGFNDFFVKEKFFPNDGFVSEDHFSDDTQSKLQAKLKLVANLEAKTTHNIYDENGALYSEGTFDMHKMESEGTKKVIEMAGPIFDALKSGRVLLVDELDAKLHPFLTRSILQLFMNPKTNVNGAQLIFTTHDTNLLNLAYLRRDQIWFTEKDNIESSDLYSLVEFKDESGVKIRNDRSVQKDYINGRYGAIPFMN